MSKEAWFRNYERRLAESGDPEMRDPRTSERCAEQAMEDVRDQMADLADRLRDEAKER